MAAVLASVFVHLGIKKKLEHGKKQPSPSRRARFRSRRRGSTDASAAAWREDRTTPALRTRLWASDNLLARDVFGLSWEIFRVARVKAGELIYKRRHNRGRAQDPFEV
jgi:hypothetical protein